MPLYSKALQQMALAGIALVGMLAAIGYGLFDPGFGGDSLGYLTVAQNILQNGCVSLSEPAIGACQPHWGGNQFPGYPALIASAVWLSSNSLSSDPFAFVPAAIVMQSLFLAAAGYRLSLATLRLTGSTQVGLIVALLTAASPLHFAWSRWILTETMATAAVLWVFAELLWSLHHKRLSILPLGLSLALAFFLRYDTLPLCAAVVVAAFSIHPPIQALRRGMLVALILTVPVSLWTIRNMIQGLNPMPQADYGVGYLRGDGFYTWLATWTRDFYQATHAAYPFANRNYKEITIPSRVLSESGGKKAHALLTQLAQHKGKPLPKKFDEAFLRLAVERRAALPWQVYVVNPLYRTASMWLSPPYSYGWRLQLGVEAQRHLLAKGVQGALELVQENPGIVTAKAALASYRFLLTFTFFSMLILASVRPHRAGIPLAMVFAYCVAKTLFVVSLGQGDPRLTTQPYAMVEVILAMYLPFVLRNWRTKKNSRGPKE